MAKSINLKLFNNIVLVVDGNEERFNCFPDLWNRFNWDIEKDPKAGECSTEIVRAMIMFGKIDISEMAKGKHTIKLYFE